VVTAVLAALAAPAPAVAEDAAVPEAVPTKLAVRLDGDRAALRLTVRLALDGPQIHALSVDAPLHGSLIGATVRERGRTHPLDLVEAAAAGERFAAIQEAPADADARAGAILLSDQELGRIEIAAAVPRRTTLALDLDYTAPTCFLRDHRHVRIPAAWAAVLDADGRRRVVSAEVAAEPDGVAARCEPFSWEDDGGAVWLALPTAELAARAPGDDRIGARGARFAAGVAALARVELAIAATMSAVPADLATAFVVDGSRSLTGDQVAAQRDVIRSYLRHAPGSRVQVIAYDRAARPLLPRWTRADRPEIGRALDRLAPANGSDLDRGLAAAGAALADVAGTRRVVVFTDELVPARVAALDPARLADLLPAGTIVHVVALTPDGAGTAAAAGVRDDDGLFASLAIATTGLAARAAAGVDPELDALALVRPIAIDHLRVIAPAFDLRDTSADLGASCEPDLDSGTPVTLREGEACTWWSKGPATADAIAFEGRVWNRVWRRVVPLGDPASLEVARDGWAVLHGEREPTLRAALEVAARAVNRRWSLLATWGGAGGYDDQAPGGASVSACSCGEPSGDMSMDGMAGRARVRGRPVRDQVAAAIAPCRAAAPGTAIRIELDTTRHEIVAVVVDDAPPALAACAEAAVWALDLFIPEERDGAPEHAHWSLAFAPATAASDPTSSRRAPADPAPAAATP
jgi:hypothetical protein